MKYLSTKFFTSKKSAIKFGNMPLFKGFQVLGERLVIGYGLKPKVKFDKPYLIGWTVCVFKLIIQLYFKDLYLRF